jgi:ankyrin repeat protein
MPVGCQWDASGTVKIPDNELERRMALLLAAGARASMCRSAVATRPTPSHTPRVALRMQNAVGLRILLEAGAKLDLDDAQSRNILHLAALYGNTATIKCLRRAGIVGVDVGKLENGSRTPYDCLCVRSSGEEDGEKVVVGTTKPTWDEE